MNRTVYQAKNRIMGLRLLLKNSYSGLLAFLEGKLSWILPPGKVRLLMPIVGYMAGYLLCFGLIERWNRLHYTIIHTAVDDLIPFIPVFVIPYILWFPYVIGAIFFLAMVHEESFHRLCTCLMTGMTIFIAVSVVFPNIHLLRPEVMPQENVFTQMIGFLYRIDTPTNLTPSIHVYNSLAVIAAYWNWDWKKDSGRALTALCKYAGRAFITLLGMSIIFSTVLIKQHSFSDVVIAAALYLVTYCIVYRAPAASRSAAGHKRRRAARAALQGRAHI